MITLLVIYTPTCVCPYHAVAVWDYIFCKMRKIEKHNMYSWIFYTYALLTAHKHWQNVTVIREWKSYFIFIIKYIKNNNFASMSNSNAIYSPPWERLFKTADGCPFIIFKFLPILAFDGLNGCNMEYTLDSWSAVKRSDAKCFTVSW